MELKRYQTQEQMQEGIPMVRLIDLKQHVSLTVVPAIGCNIVSYRCGEREWIAGPPSLQYLRESPTRYGVPILFPPNRIRHAVYEWNGQRYILPANAGTHHMHGPIASMAWEVLNIEHDEHAGCSISCRLAWRERGELRDYPDYPIDLTWRLELKEGIAAITLTIRNDSHWEQVPVAAGFHPYFALRGSDASLHVPAAEEWLIGEDRFPTGKHGESDFCRQLREGFDPGRLGEGYRLVRLEDGESCCAVKDRSTGEELLLMTDKELPFLVVFRPMNAIQTVSLEPYSCVTDAFNREEPDEMTGARGLKPGESLTFRWSMQGI